MWTLIHHGISERLGLLPFEKATVLSTERSLSECAVVNCCPVNTDLPVSLTTAMWDDRK